MAHLSPNTRTSLQGSGKGPAVEAVETNSQKDVTKLHRNEEQREHFPMHDKKACPIDRKVKAVEKMVSDAKPKKKPEKNAASKVCH